MKQVIPTLAAVLLTMLAVTPATATNRTNACYRQTPVTTGSILRIAQPRKEYYPPQGKGWCGCIWLTCSKCRWDTCGPIRPRYCGDR